jgi:hypothetical protein
MPAIADLLQKAEAATVPATSKSRSTWAQFFPVIDKLVAERDFTAWSATAWLVENGAFHEGNRRVCYHSYLGYAKRKAAKATVK